MVRTTLEKTMPFAKVPIADASCANHLPSPPPQCLTTDYYREWTPAVELSPPLPTPSFASLNSYGSAGEAWQSHSVKNSSGGQLYIVTSFITLFNHSEKFVSQKRW